MVSTFNTKNSSNIHLFKSFYVNCKIIKIFYPQVEKIVFPLSHPVFSAFDVRVQRPFSSAFVSGIARRTFERAAV